MQIEGYSPSLRPKFSDHREKTGRGSECVETESVETESVSTVRVCFVFGKVESA